MTLARTLLAILVAFLLSMPALAAAQEPLRDFGQLSKRIRPGDTISVFDPSGRETRGKVRTIESSALTIEREGLEAIQADSVRQITLHKGRPIRRGVIAGLAVFGVAGAVFASAAVREDPSSCGGACIARTVGGWAGIGAGYGALMGAIIPGKELVVYRAPSPAGASSGRLSVAPLLSPSAKGVAISFAF